MSTGLRGGSNVWAKAIAMIALVVATSAGGAPSLSVHELPDGSRWLVGCADEDVAAQMVASGQFESTGPVGILCIVGYAAVHRRIK